MWDIGVRWQDPILAIVTITLAYSLIPQVIKGFRVKKGLISLQTLIVRLVATSVIVWVVNFTLRLYFSVMIGTICLICWLILLIQRIIWGDIEDEMPET